MEESGGFKLIIRYDVRPEEMQSYYRFMLGRFVPLLAELGLEMSDAWHTAYGDQPNRLIGFIARDRATIRSILDADAWQVLTDELLGFVNDLDYKVVPYRHGFQF